MKRSIPCFIVEARGKCFGPFASETDALADARDGMDDDDESEEL